VVEDSPHGIEAGQKSGATVIVVSNATEVHS
jgi:beta-phosphoglucomutase-like phosphatase (HAD superfamily)